MTHDLIDTAMILAAGLGKRMRPITDTLPKPLVKFEGKALIDHSLERLREAGIRRVVVNVHHLGEQIIEHLARCPDMEILISEEKTLLESGGGVKQALPLLDRASFFVINADSLWFNGYQPLLGRMRREWDRETMQALLGLHPVVSSCGYTAQGDFFCDQEGRLLRRAEAPFAPFAFMGVQILKADLIDAQPQEFFSLNTVYDVAMEKKQLFGLRHDGVWLHIGSPQDLSEAGDYMKEHIL